MRLELTNSNTSPISALALVPGGKSGIIATLRAMRGFVQASKKNPKIRLLAGEIVQDVRGKDWRGECEKIHEWVRDNITYRRDINGVETVSDAERTLQAGFGDCDDKSVLFATLCESIGHPTRFVAVGFVTPDSYSHVFTETRIGRSWISSDTTESSEFGWRPPGIKSALIVHN